MDLGRHMHEVIIRREPVTLTPETSVLEACRAMRRERIGAVVVTDPAGRLRGIFTGRDAICRMLAEGRDPAATTLAEVMTARPTAMGPNELAVDALRLMQDGGFRHVPVVEGEQLLGMVSRGDFAAAERARLEEDSYLWERM